MTETVVLFLHKLPKVYFNKTLYITNKHYVYQNINTALESISIIKNHS